MTIDSKRTRARASRRSRRLAAPALAALALGLWLVGCDRSFQATRPPERAVLRAPAPAGEHTAAEQAPRGVPLADMLAPYPHGRWRLAPRADLGSVRIWASHILIRHRDATLRGVVFGPLETASVPPSERTRADARELAERIAKQARAAPDRFAELARRSSEDPVTQTTGGSLGAVHGFSLLTFPQVLDSFAALQPGEVSHVVETDYGFHVFQLRPPLTDRTFNASHIVIGYDEATWLTAHLARGPVPHRSRAEALALAGSLYERARAAPHEFAQLVAEHSEHLDALHGGDLGAWSTRNPGAYSRQIELLNELPVYGIAPPIDTLYGIEIVQRTPDRPRQRFAMDMIRLPFDPAAAAPDPSSKPTVLALAKELARQLSREPQRFAALQAKYCCTAESLQWTERQEPTLVAYAAERLALGGIATEPFEFASTMAIPRRIDPALVPAAAPLQFQLPAPADIDLDTVASRTPRDVMQENLSRIAAQVERALALDALGADALRSASQLPAEFSDEASGKQRREVFRDLLERVKGTLGADQYSRYLELSRAHFRAWTLEQPI